VLHQFISSGITHYPGYFIQLGSRMLIRMNHQVLTEDGSLSGKVQLVKGIHGHKKNPFGGMNLGIIDIETPSPDALPRLRFLLYGHKGEEPVRAFASDLIIPNEG
jgi:alkaline phosphatase D